MIVKTNTELFKKALWDYLEKFEVTLTEIKSDEIKLKLDDIFHQTDTTTTALESMATKIMMILEDCSFDHQAA